MIGLGTALLSICILYSIHRLSSSQDLAFRVLSHRPVIAQALSNQVPVESYLGRPVIGCRLAYSGYNPGKRHRRIHGAHNVLHQHLSYF